jgi:hypothetical protein
MLLFAMSARRDAAWSSFSDAVDAIFTPDERVADDVRHVRYTVASLGDSLGHWDIANDDSGSARLVASPPVLATLPRCGRPTAILCGSRSPDSYPAITEAARARGVSVASRRQDRLQAYAPSRIEVTADTHAVIAELAKTVGIAFRRLPPAWALASACGSTNDYVASRPWAGNAELNWTRRDFDPSRLRFAPATTPIPTGSLSLSAYTHPGGWVREDRLVRTDGESASVDRNWARYAVLADRGIKVLGYDPRAATVHVPRQVPLPNVAARALALCSGEPPRYAQGPGLGWLVYAGVPREIYAILAAKLGQEPVAQEEEGTA